LYADRPSADGTTLITLIRSLAKNQKYEHVRQLKFKIYILFYGGNSSTAALK
jgi:hypothetical protein